MRRGVMVMVLAAAFSAAFAVPAWAQPACGETITEDTTLESDLTCYDWPSIGVVIGAPGITLDLGGHSIRTIRSAIVNEGHHDVTIRNGTVTGEEGAIRLTGVKRNLIEDMRFERGVLYGVRASDSDRNRIVSNEFAGMGVSLRTGSDRNTVERNSFNGYESFVSMESSNDNRVLDNVIQGGEGPKMTVYEASGNRIARNHVLSDVDVAISLIRANYTELVDNVTGLASGGGANGGGIRLRESSSTLLRGNIFARASPGVLVESGAENALRGNVAFLGNTDGFVVEEAAFGTLVQNNDAVSNADDGFEIRSPGTVLTRNTANGNGDLGIEAVAGVVDGGGNRASGNGNPLQCVNVFCR
jgi:parallel beta-helix repeat protein